MINPVFNLRGLPQRPEKPRNKGMNMMMDKGLTLTQLESLLDTTSSAIDLVKLGFGTAVVTQNLEDKLKLYKQADIPVFFGGTLFEAYVQRGQIDDYKRTVEHYGLGHVEISDGSIDIPEEEKLEYIQDFAKNYTVLSEVGSKDIEVIIPPYKWIHKMRTELEAGAWKVIGEARESGTVGIFRPSGEIRSGLVEEILTQIPPEDILWEAPKKNQQVWFLQTHGADVNLGNIAPEELIPLETLRLGLRGDTFHTWL